MPAEWSSIRNEPLLLPLSVCLGGQGRYQDGRHTESLWGPQTIALGVLSCKVSGEAQRVPPAVSVSTAIASSRSRSHQDFSGGSSAL